MDEIDPFGTKMPNKSAIVNTLNLFIEISDRIYSAIFTDGIDYHGHMFYMSTLEYFLPFRQCLFVSNLLKCTPFHI